MQAESKRSSVIVSITIFLFPLAFFLLPFSFFLFS